jgi:hypothetical protein
MSSVSDERAECKHSACACKGALVAYVVRDACLHSRNAWATARSVFQAFSQVDSEAVGEVLMRGGLVVALLLLAVSSAQAQAHDTARYTFGGAAEQGTFVLDTQTGRVWRYDRVDDAWYLYDLEALVRTPRGEAGRTLRDEPEKPAPEKGRAE